MSDLPVSFYWTGVGILARMDIGHERRPGQVRVEATNEDELDLRGPGIVIERRRVC